jgi:hypothetical protein
MRSIQREPRVKSGHQTSSADRGASGKGQMAQLLWAQTDQWKENIEKVNLLGKKT